VNGYLFLNTVVLLLGPNDVLEALLQAVHGKEDFVPAETRR